MDEGRSLDFQISGFLPFDFASALLFGATFPKARAICCKKPNTIVWQCDLWHHAHTYSVSVETIQERFLQFCLKADAQKSAFPFVSLHFAPSAPFASSLCVSTCWHRRSWSWASGEWKGWRRAQRVSKAYIFCPSPPHASLARRGPPLVLPQAPRCAAFGEHPAPKFLNRQN